jgi:glycosyltransferase involved in cell wall biosynthesis
MRLAYVSSDPGVPVFGRNGSSIHVQEVIRALLAQGIDIDLFATRRGGKPTQDIAGIGVHRLAKIPKGDRGTWERAAYGANTGLCSALAEGSAYDAIYERYSLWSYAAMGFARDNGIPGLLEVNAPLIDEQIKHRGLINPELAMDVAERVYAAAAHLIAVSDEVAAYLEGFDAAKGKISVIPNGVDAKRFPPDLTPSLPATPSWFTLGFVGSIKPWHGLNALVDTFDILHRSGHDARLLIVGDGPERPALEAELAARGLDDAVQWTGAVDHDRVPGLLASMDAAIAPYPDGQKFYFSPLKIFEYMAAGLPVVASRIGQIDKVLRHGETGLLCPAGSAPDLASAVARLIEDRALGRKLGNAAREVACHEHSWDGVAREILSLSRRHAGNMQPAKVA